MKKTAQVICIFLTVMLIMPSTLSVFAKGSTGSIVASGYCGAPENAGSSEFGRNLRWSLDESGTLTISGNGEMPSFYQDFTTPWNDAEVKRVVMAEGTENVSCCAFSGCTQLESVELPGSIKSIEYNAFPYRGEISVILPDSADVFYTCFDYASVTLFRGDYDKAGKWDYGVPYDEEYPEYENFEMRHTKNISFTEGTKYLPLHIFDRQADLRKVIIPDSIANFSWYHFDYSCYIHDFYFSASAEKMRSIEENYNELAYSGEFEYEYDDPFYTLEHLLNIQLHRVEYIDGHYIEKIEGYAATETAHGLTDGLYCVDTDSWARERVTVHNTFGKKTMISEPTDTEPGECIYTCTVCGERWQDEYPIVIASGICGLNTDEFIPNTNNEFGIDYGCTHYTKYKDNITWSLDSTSTLTFSGTGKMAFYLSVEPIAQTYTGFYEGWFEPAPWSNWANQIKKVVVSDGIENIGAGAFGRPYYREDLVSVKFPNLTSVALPAGLKEIENSAFASCPNLKIVSLTNSVDTIGESAFLSCNALTDVFYFGTPEQWNSIEIGNRNDCLLNAALHFVDGEYEYIYVDATEATATEHGYTAGIYCVNTDTYISGHEVIHNTIGEMTVLREPTETESGECIIVCTVCGESGLYAMDPIIHDPEDPDDPSNDEPEDGEPNDDNGFFSNIRRMMRTIIDFFLRILRWLGGKK